MRAVEDAIVDRSRRSKRRREPDGLTTELSAALGPGEERPAITQRKRRWEPHHPSRTQPPFPLGFIAKFSSPSPSIWKRQVACKQQDAEACGHATIPSRYVSRPVAVSEETDVDVKMKHDEDAVLDCAERTAQEGWREPKLAVCCRPNIDQPAQMPAVEKHKVTHRHDDRDIVDGCPPYEPRPQDWISGVRKSHGCHGASQKEQEIEQRDDEYRHCQPVAADAAHDSEEAAERKEEP